MNSLEKQIQRQRTWIEIVESTRQIWVTNEINEEHMKSLHGRARTNRSTHCFSKEWQSCVIIRIAWYGYIFALRCCMVMSCTRSGPMCSTWDPSTHRRFPRKFDLKDLSLWDVTANLCTKILDFRGFDSSRILTSRCGTLMSAGNFLASLSDAILVGTILAGRLDSASDRNSQPFKETNIKQ